MECCVEEETKNRFEFGKHRHSMAVSFNGLSLVVSVVVLWKFDELIDSLLQVNGATEFQWVGTDRMSFFSAMGGVRDRQHFARSSVSVDE